MSRLKTLSLPSKAICRRGRFYLVLVIVLGVEFTASAQVEFSVSPNPVGSGARAAGMADAFVAVADDATAASWNPGGLVQLERPELSIVGSYIGVREDFETASNPEFETMQDSSNLDLNFLSLVIPIPTRFLNRRAAIGLSYQRKFDFTRSFDVNFNSSLILENGTQVNRFLTDEFRQEGGLSTITPSLALEIVDNLSIGVSLNLWRSSFISENGWSQSANIQTRTQVGNLPPTFGSLLTHQEYTNLSGENYVIGVLWKPTGKLRLGARYDSSFKADVDYEATAILDGVDLGTINEKRKVGFPDSIAFGASYRANDKVIAALDVTRTDWNDFYVEDAGGTRTSIIDGTELGDPATHTELDPTYTVRLGLEYVFIPKELNESLDTLWTLRAGLFFDQEPASGRTGINPTMPGDGSPDNFYGLALGMGLLAFQRMNFDLAYQIRYGSNVNADFIPGVPGFHEDVLQHRLLFSTIVYF